MIRLLAVDIDGTLLDSQGRIPRQHHDALAEAVERGVSLALVTGRSFHFTRPIIEMLGLPLVAIVNNGAVLKQSDGTTRLRQVLPRAAALDILANTVAFEDSVALVFDRDDDRQIVFERMDWSHPHRRGYFERNKSFIAAVASLTNALDDDPIQVMFNGAVAPMRRLAAILRALPRAPYFTVAVTEYERRDFSLVDVNGQGCSKGTTLAQWTTELGLEPAEVMAVGDNLNDLDMLEFAGTAVVMGNASSDIQSRGLILTGTNDEGGLAQAVRRFVLSNPP